MKHIHANIIKAWADGATIEVKGFNGAWTTITKDTPNWKSPEYRIKPEVDENVVQRAAFASGNAIEFRKKNRPKAAWQACGEPMWSRNYEYRIAPPKPVEDPHKALKEAVASGKKVQKLIAGQWADLNHFVWSSPVCDYRIKPEQQVRFAIAESTTPDRIYGAVRSMGPCNSNPLNNIQLTFEDGKLVDAKVLQ